MKKTLLSIRLQLTCIIIGVPLFMGVGVHLAFGTVNFSCQTVGNPTSGNGKGGGGRDNAGGADSCMGSPCASCGGKCTVSFLPNGSPIPNGQYCMKCYAEDCACQQTGNLDCVTFNATCAKGSCPGGDGGADPCYCQPGQFQQAQPDQLPTCGGAS